MWPAPTHHASHGPLPGGEGGAPLSGLAVGLSLPSLGEGGPAKPVGGSWAGAALVLPACIPGASIILNHMVQFQSTPIDASFAALSDPTRRGVLERLGRAEASISELAESFEMTLTGMKKHVSVLEQAGLVVTAKIGRVRTCRLGGRGLAEEAAWIERYNKMWAGRFVELDRLIDQLKQKELSNGRKADE